jgi:polyisoprenoid-binding protein YceI
MAYSDEGRQPVSQLIREEKKEVAMTTGLRVLVLCIGLVIGVPNFHLPTEAVSNADNPTSAPAQRYRLDSSQSKFLAHALRGGLLWFRGYDHLVAVSEFSGEAQMTPDSITPASLEITAKAASMVETNSVFTDQQKQIINKELREIVLQPDQYPDITFRSTSVTGKAAGANQYDLKITGDLTLHGVTRPINIPTHVTIAGNDLRAQGEFSVNRDDFKVKATSAAHGLVRVRNKIKFTFDIVGHSM